MKTIEKYNKLKDMNILQPANYSIKVVRYNMKNETWKSVVGYEGLYEVSDAGSVRSVKFGRQRILKPRKQRDGYLLVQLCKDGKVKHMQVHRLVAQAFIPNPNNLDTVNHRDEVKTNNAVGNLEWMSRGDNLNYGTRNSRMAEALSKPVQMLDKSTGGLLATFPSTQEAQRVTRIDHGSISKCCLGKLKLAGGYVWKYA